jgi:hypothetical protein
MKKYMNIIHPKIRLPYSTLQNSLHKNSCKNTGIKLFNKLPNTIKRVERTQEFKRRLNYFFMQHLFYLVDEHMSF